MTPVLYSFRRCPYAMRARLAIAVSGAKLELREILLREKPKAFLDVSLSATVPCLQTPEGIIDESLDIMIWALKKKDPEGWLDMPDAGYHWIIYADGPFKHALDRTKYSSRYPSENADQHRQTAAAFLAELDAQIDLWIFAKPTLADFAILPFVRQFALIDKRWFDAQPWPCLQAWLAQFLESDRFTQIMQKYPVWQEGEAQVLFPA